MESQRAIHSNKNMSTMFARITRYSSAIKPFTNLKPHFFFFRNQNIK